MDIEKWCRICSIEVKCGVFLFSEEAKQAFLHAKIRKYLSVSVNLEDKLPKMICEDCIVKINGFHSFATMALKNQEKMTRCVLSTPVSPEPTKTDNVSLLHTYLTKITEDKDSPLNEPEETEMEVRVDPMSVLQCCLEESEPETDSELMPEDPAHEEDEESDEDPEGQSGLQESGSSESDNSENTCIIYLCSVCKRSFSSNNALQQHMYIHSATYTKRILSFSLNKFQTNLATVFVNNTQLEKKEDDAQNGETQEHTEKEEPSVIYKCPICAKDITSKGALKVHLETHRPKGQYGCDICGRVFKTQCNLFRHKEYHQGVQFPCEVCGRVYPTNSTLRAHSITHSDLRPHKCPLCDKTFKRNQDLKFHINQHTGARPYQCPYCPKAFASSGNCFSHRKRMHPIEVERDRERAAKIMR
ncbi:zinc finger protein 664-like [Euwallacea fornicatus]|uniref:zinc finger protein 664-like n=1 Tax=Euwallacea fornicatus TaxID=995702 RepID=UPI00338DBB6B